MTILQFLSVELAQGRRGDGGAADGRRLHGAAGTQARGPHPESLGTQPRRAVRAAAAAGRWRKILSQRRHHSDPASIGRSICLRRSSRLSCALISIAVVPFGEPGVVGPGELPLLPDRRRQYRPACDPWHHVDRRLRHRAGGMVLEQQVFPARLSALFGAAGQLRTGAGSVAGWRCAARRIAQSAM